MERISPDEIAPADAGPFFGAIVRSEYYGGNAGRWRLLVDRAGDPILFKDLDQAAAAIEREPLGRSETARAYLLFRTTDTIHVARDARRADG